MLNMLKDSNGMCFEDSKTLPNYQNVIEWKLRFIFSRCRFEETSLIPGNWFACRKCRPLILMTQIEKRETTEGIL